MKEKLVKFFRNHFVPNINVQKLKLKLENPVKLVLLDIRTPEEWKESGLIPGSIALPMIIFTYANIK
jgi:rhodanese-related sulfurtransferase